MLFQTWKVCMSVEMICIDVNCDSSRVEYGYFLDTFCKTIDAPIFGSIKI